MKKKRETSRGMTLIESVLAMTLVFMVVGSVCSYVLFTFRVSSKTFKHNETVANVVVALTHLEKILLNIDNVYLDVDVDIDTGEAVSNVSKIFFRTSYIPTTVGYDATVDSMATRWGCIWFRKEDGLIVDRNEMKIFRTQEVSYHQDTGLNWLALKSFFGLEDVLFECLNNQVKVTVSYRQGEMIKKKYMLFSCDKIQKISDFLADDEEPIWT
ncbi:hypothetical protein AB834_04610 [PVC group bacterium (ex Bugula neritina AB1)]|nr:hypothetical protein AB834_04610 [PVC group bacterium (ex Bugula neritina AB1)]